MEESSSFNLNISQRISEELKMFLKIRESYMGLRSDCKNLQDENVLLKTMLNIAQDNEKFHGVARKCSEFVVLKQNKIIEDMMNVKEENMKFKEELERCNEMVKNLYLEMNEVREKTADEIKAAQDSHEEELARYREQYIQQEKQMRIDFDVEKLNLERTVAKLKEDIEVINNEKTVLVAVTVKEYEDQLQSLRDALHGAKMELKSLEETHNVNISIYKNKLQEQEKHYISTLENIQSEVLPNTTIGVNKSTSHVKQTQQHFRGVTDVSSELKNHYSNSKKHMTSIRDLQTSNGNRPSNVPNISLIMPNSISVHQKQHGQSPGAINSTNSLSRKGISVNCKQGKAVLMTDFQLPRQHEQLCVARDTSRSLVDSCTHSRLSEQHLTSLSEFDEQDYNKSERPCNKSYYKRLNLPSPKPFKTLPRQTCGENFMCAASNTVYDSNCSGRVRFTSNDGFPGKSAHKVSDKCSITVCNNFGSNKSNDSDRNGSEPAVDNDAEGHNYFLKVGGSVSKKRKLCDPKNYTL